MEYGRSLVLQSLLHARETAHGQTRELQIVCPACSEPVHKRGSVITKRQYFAHYSAKPGSECELRVLTIVRQALHPTVIVPRGQELQRFLAHFEEIVLEHNPSFKIGYITGLLSSMRARKRYHEMLLRLRPVFRHRWRNSNMINLVTLPEMREAVHEVVLFLTAANSFAAFLFAVSFGLLFSYCASHSPYGFRLREQGGISVPISPDDLNEIRNSIAPMVELTDSGLRRWLRTLSGERQETLGMDLLSALCESACQFVYAVSESHVASEAADKSLSLGNK